MSTSHPEFDLSKYKKFYKSIGAVKCPYFGGELIIFNSKGFDHLLFSKGAPRSFYDRKRRLKLLIYCKRILEGEHHRDVGYRKEPTAQFWAFEARINSIKMRLLVRKVRAGQKHFFDILPI